MNQKRRIFPGLLARARLLMAATALGVAAGLVWVDGSGGALAVGPPTVPGSSCPTFLPDSVWNTPVSNLPVNARSGDWLAASGATAGRKLHPDFGGPPYGMPINVVHSSHATTTFKFDYADESDPGPYPYGSDLQIEQGGDAHLLTVNQDTCRLYEVYATNNNGPGTAGSGAIWDLRSHALRRDGATSSDAAGLPVFPGLVRRDEVAAGAIRHAIRFSVQHTDRSHVWPARHDAGSASDPALPPMGARFRLKSSFDASSYGPEARVVLTAMQNYGLILADNGSNWFFQGTMDPGWNDPQYDTMISQLKTIPASAFEAVDESSLMVDPNSDQARQSPGGPVPSTPTPVPARSTPTPSAVAPSPTATPESTPTPGKVPGSPTPTPARPNKPPRQGPGCWPIWAPPPVH